MQLKELDTEGFSRLKNLWLESILPGGHAVVRTEYEQLFEFVETNKGLGPLKDALNRPMFYAMTDEAGKDWAMVEIVQSRKGGEVWVKMLDIHLCPRLDSEVEDSENVKKRLSVFTEALIGIFNLTKGIPGASVVKVYGRTEALIVFLRGMHDSYSVLNSLGTIRGIEVTIEGRWLVFRAEESA